MADDLYIRHNDSWFKFCDVEADGNCLYYSLAKCPTTPLGTAEAIRKVLAEIMKKPSETLMNFFVEYHKSDEDPNPSLQKWEDSVLKDRSWGSNFESSLFGAIFGVDVRTVRNTPSGMEECDTRTMLGMFEIDAEKVIPNNATAFYLYLHKHGSPQQPTRNPNHYAVLEPVDCLPPGSKNTYEHPGSSDSSTEGNSASQNSSESHSVSSSTNKQKDRIEAISKENSGRNITTSKNSNSKEVRNSGNKEVRNSGNKEVRNSSSKEAQHKQPARQSNERNVSNSGNKSSTSNQSKNSRTQHETQHKQSMKQSNERNQPGNVNRKQTSEHQHKSSGIKETHQKHKDPIERSTQNKPERAPSNSDHQSKNSGTQETKHRQNTKQSSKAPDHHSKGSRPQQVTRQVSRPQQVTRQVSRSQQNTRQVNRPQQVTRQVSENKHASQERNEVVRKNSRMQRRNTTQQNSDSNPASDSMNSGSMRRRTKRPEHTRDEMSQQEQQHRSEDSKREMRIDSNTRNDKAQHDSQQRVAAENMKYEQNRSRRAIGDEPDRTLNKPLDDSRRRPRNVPNQHHDSRRGEDHSNHYEGNKSGEQLRDDHPSDQYAETKRRDQEDRNSSLISRRSGNYSPRHHDQRNLDHTKEQRRGRRSSTSHNETSYSNNTVQNVPTADRYERSNPSSINRPKSHIGRDREEDQSKPGMGHPTGRTGPKPALRRVVRDDPNPSGRGREGYQSLHRKPESSQGRDERLASFIESQLRGPSNNDKRRRSRSASSTNRDNMNNSSRSMVDRDEARQSRREELMQGKPRGSLENQNISQSRLINRARQYQDDVEEVDGMRDNGRRPMGIEAFENDEYQEPQEPGYREPGRRRQIEDNSYRSESGNRFTGKNLESGDGSFRGQGHRQRGPYGGIEKTDSSLINGEGVGDNSRRRRSDPRIPGDGHRDHMRKQSIGYNRNNDDLRRRNEHEEYQDDRQNNAAPMRRRADIKHERNDDGRREVQHNRRKLSTHLKANSGREYNFADEIDDDIKHERYDDGRREVQQNRRKLSTHLKANSGREYNFADEIDDGSYFDVHESNRFDNRLDNSRRSQHTAPAAIDNMDLSRRSQHTAPAAINHYGLNHHAPYGGTMAQHYENNRMGNSMHAESRRSPIRRDHALDRRSPIQRNYNEGRRSPMQRAFADDRRSPIQRAMPAQRVPSRNIPRPSSYRDQPSSHRIQQEEYHRLRRRSER